MPYPTNALTTLQTLKDELGIGAGENTHDDALGRLAGVATDLIEKFCKRTFLRGTVTSERVAGFGTPRLFLARTPVVSVTSVIIDGTTIDSTTYYVEDDEQGSLFCSSCWDWTKPDPGPRGFATEERKYLVTYVGGYYLPGHESRNLPFPIEEACIMAVVGRFRARGKYTGLDAETVQGDTRAWADFTLPAAARQLLEQYKRVMP